MDTSALLCLLLLSSSGAESTVESTVGHPCCAESESLVVTVQPREAGWHHGLELRWKKSVGTRLASCVPNNQRTPLNDQALGVQMPRCQRDLTLVTLKVQQVTYLCVRVL
jgi:hypothetical protein